ncbi:hypothetical protein CSB11_00820 [Candidatus Campbellbacteria bacterium]|nr:MAG: hypothetical protein CSB11_00820 [Candidatus Campbellbacteria bacterium]
MKNLNQSLKASLFVVAVSSLAVWDISFNFGAYGIIFFYKIFSLWVVSTALLLAHFLFEKDKKFLNKWSIFALLTPTVWAFIEVWENHAETIYITDSIISFIAIVACLIALPYVLYIFFNIIVLEASSFPKKMIYKIVLINIIIAICGFLLGANNYILLDCEDFKKSGMEEPANCFKPVEIEK